MDRTRKKSTIGRWWYAAAIFLLGSVAAGYWLGKDDGVRVAENRLTVRTVTNEQFYEYINLTGRVTPEETYFIDSKISGNVERIYAESGREVRRGDTLLFVSNADLELDVMQRESQLIEQLNAQQQTRLLLNQNDFTRREQLVEVDYQLALRSKQNRRGEVLLADSLISLSEYEPTENRFAYLTRRRELLQAAYEADSLARGAQIRQFDRAEARLTENLRRVRSILDRQYVLAATDGVLSDFTVRTGQAVTTGERLGEISRMKRPVLVAEADEFYLDRIYAGQAGQLLSSGDTVALEVRKIYPTVENGRFRIEVGLAEVSVGEIPAATVGRRRAGAMNWTKGQSVRIRLFFGEPSPSVLLASGNFYASTGGRWVYRLLSDGRAERTPVRLGRANPDQYEVLEGLQPGDRVITSAYDDFKDYETIILN